MKQPGHTIAILLVALLGSAPMLAYTVVLKDGKQMFARERYQINGDQVVITLPSGTQTTIPLSEVDLEGTEELNRSGLGDAMVVDGGENRPLQLGIEPQSRQTTLQDLIRARSQNGPASEDGSETAEPSTSLRLTPAGNPDLTTLQRRPLERNDLGDTARRLLFESGLRGFRLHHGTQQGRIFLEVVADAKESVFDSLEKSAGVFVELQVLHPQCQAFEILMQTPNGSRAAQFLLDDSNAELLTKRRLSPGQFFTEYVQF